MINDTTPDAERVLNDVLRRMSIGDKSRRLEDLYQTGRVLHEAGFRQRSPNATAQAVVDDWMRLTLEPELYRKVREWMDNAGP